VDTASVWRFTARRQKASLFFCSAKRSLLAQICRNWSGRACPLCPGLSDVNLFRYRQRINRPDWIAAVQPLFCKSGE
jgi:hypothetical protein